MWCIFFGNAARMRWMEKTPIGPNVCIEATSDSHNKVTKLAIKVLNDTSHTASPSCT